MMLRNAYIALHFVPMLLMISPYLLGESSFSRDVQPILKKHCAACHQPASKSAGLDLATFEGFRTGGKRGAAFVPGEPEKSIVVKFIAGELKPPMPLGGSPLSEHDVAIVREWIQAGTKDDTPHETISTEPTVYHQPPVVTAIGFSPDGQFLAVGGNREVLLHRTDGGGIVQRLPGRAERILSIAFSEDGKTMIAVRGNPSRFGEIQVWSPAEGKLLRSIEVSSDTVFGGAVSADGKEVAVGCTDNTVRAFDTATGKELFKIASHENWPLSMVFGIDSKRVVPVSRDRAAQLIDANAGQFLDNVNQLHSELAAISRHPKVDEIVTGGDDRVPYIYMMDRPRNVKAGEEATLVRKLETQDAPIFALACSPDGNRIAVAGASSSVNLYNAGTGDRVAAACKGHEAGIYSLAFSPDSRTLTVGGFDGRVPRYRTADCTLQKAFIPVPLATQVADRGGVQ